MSVARLNPGTLTPPRGAYSHAITAAARGTDLLFVTGQLPLDVDRRLVSDGLVGQVEAIVDRLRAVLESAHFSFFDVMALRVYLTEARTSSIAASRIAEHEGLSGSAVTFLIVPALVVQGCLAMIDAVAIRQSAEHPCAGPRGVRGLPNATSSRA